MELKKFSRFTISYQEQAGIKGGDNCTNCIASALIACDASCGNDARCYNRCVDSQTAQCIGMYCGGGGGGGAMQ